MTELEKTQEEYIKLLEKSISSSELYLHIHNWDYPDDIIKRSEELRLRIKELKGNQDE